MPRYYARMSDLAHPESSFTFTGRVRSVTHAVRGLRLMLVTQHNAWLHAIATGGVVALGFVVGISAGEWCWIVLSLMAVWTSEGSGGPGGSGSDMTDRMVLPRRAAHSRARTEHP